MGVDRVGRTQWEHRSGAKIMGAGNVGKKQWEQREWRTSKIEEGREVELSVEKTRCKFVSSR